MCENCFSEMGYCEFKRDLYNGNLFEGVRVAALWVSMMSWLKESAADICSKLASLEEFERFVDGESVW